MPQSGEERPPHWFTYSFGPFVFHSLLKLPELPPAAAADLSQISVKLVPGLIPDRIDQPVFQGQFCTVSRDEMLIRIPEIASYHVRNGCQITVQAAAGASALDVRGFLLGNIFAVLCHQQRLLPLHASAVRMGDGVVAFLGNSGAGKSTLAAYLSQAGHPLVADDICLLDPAAPLAERVIPVAPWLKLWRGSLEALGQGTAGLAQTFTDEDKFRVPTGSAIAEGRVVETQRLPLRAVIVLESRSMGGVAGAPTLNALKPVHAIKQMMDFTYQAYLLNWLGLQAEHFSHCGKGLEGAAAYTCERDWGFASLPAMLACLRAEFD